MQPRTNNFPYPTPAGSPIPVEDTSDQSANVADGGDLFAAFEGLNESAIVNYCKTRNAVFQTWFDSYIKKLGQLHLMFRNAPTASKAGKVVSLPVASGIVESINARLQPALLNRPKVVEAIPEFLSENNDAPRLVEDFVNQKVMEVTRKPEKGKQAIKSAVVETMMIWRNVWRQETSRTTEPVYVPDPMFMPDPTNPMAQPKMIYQGEQELEKNKQYWDWELENPANMAWDPHTITKLSMSPWARKRAPKSYNELLRLQAEGMFKGVERLRLVVPKGASGQMKEGWEDELRRASGDNNWNFTYADEKLYEVEEWWADMTWMVNDAPVQKKLRWFLVEGAYVVSVDENPLLPQRLPWDSCPLIQDPHSLTGLSPLDVVRNLQEQVNTYAGYQDSLAERMATPTIFYDESSGLSGRTSFKRTYGLQPVQNVQGIKEMTLDSSPIQAVQAYISFLIDLMRDATGANEQFQGTEGADTATEFEGLVASAGSRFADVVDTLSQGWLEALGTECYLHYKQFGVDGQMFARAAATEGQVSAVTRGDLSGDYTFVATSASTEKAKTQELEMAMKAIQMGASMPPSPDGTIFNAQKAYRDTVLPLLGQKNGADWFTQMPAPPMPMGGGMPGQEQPMPMGMGVENA
jgi:hypothetical protein